MRTWKTEVIEALEFGSIHGAITALARVEHKTPDHELVQGLVIMADEADYDMQEYLLSKVETYLRATELSV